MLMKKKRFSVEQMIGVLKQAQIGISVAEVILKAGISEQSFYRWKAKPWRCGPSVAHPVSCCRIAKTSSETALNSSHPWKINTIHESL
jgi:hypothetical protein